MTPAHHRTPLTAHGGAIGELREHNLALLMWELIARGQVSRNELGTSTGLSPAAVSKLVGELRSRHLATELSSLGTVGNRGRRGTDVRLSTERWALAAAVLAPNELHVVVAGLDGSPLAESRVPIADPGNSEGYLGTLCKALRGATVETHKRGLELLSVEISVTGGVNRNAGRVVFSPTLGWIDVDVLTPVHDLLRERLSGVSRNVSVHVDSDVNHAMLARLEQRAGSTTLPGYGAEANAAATTQPSLLPRLPHNNDAPTRWGRNPSVVYLGGAATVGGSLYHGAVERGSDGLAGQYGHIIVDPRGAHCWCGRRGCLEACIGIAALHAAAVGGETSIDVVPQDTGAMLGRVLEALENDSPRAQEAMYQAGLILGSAIDALGVILNPHSVVIDGFLARLGPELRRGVSEHLHEVWNAPEVYYPTVSFVDDEDDPTIRGCLLMAAQSIASRPSMALAG